MRLEKLHLTAFGKFRGRELELGPGLNLVFGPNEAGKSTVQHFIYGMLYGFFKAGARRRIRMEDMDRFAPWQNGGGYRGSLVYRLEHTGRRLRVDREFGARPTVRLTDADTGRPVSAVQDSGSREPQFCREHTGLSGDEFLRTACVAQGLLRMADAGDLAARIANLHRTGREEVSLQRVDRRLDELRRPVMEQLRQTRELCRSGEAELQRLIRTREQSLADAERLAVLEVETRRLAGELAACEGELDAARLAELEDRLHRVRARQAELEAVESRLAELAPYAGFPAEREAEAVHLEGLLPELAAEAERAGASFRQAAEAQAEAERALAPLAPLGGLPLDAGALAVQLLERWNGAQGEWARRRSNLGSIRAQVARGAAELDARRALGEPAEVEARLERLIAACAAAGAAEPAMWAARLKAARRRGRNRAAMAAPLLGLAAAAAAAAVGLGPARPWLGYGLLAASAGLAAGAAVCAGARQVVRRLDTELEHVRAHVDEWARLSSGLGAAGADGLRAAVRDWLRQADRLAHDAEQLAALEHELDRLQEQVQETARDLELLLRPVTSLLSCAGAGLEPRVTALTELLQRYRELTGVCGQRRQQGAAAAARLEAAQARLQEAHVRLDDLLDATGLADLAAYRAAAARRREWDRQAWQRGELRRNLEELWGQGGEQRLELERAELAARLEAAAAGAAASPVSGRGTAAGVEAAAAGGNRAALEAAGADLRLRLQAARQETDRLQGALHRANGETADLDRLSREVQALQDRLAGLEDEKWALDTARRELAEAAADMHREFAPRLNGRIAAVLPRLTAGRYGEVAVQEDLQVHVEVADLGGRVAADQLSAGTRDQLYLALRVALVELLVPPDRDRPPLILDDPFTQADACRLTGGMALLAELARDYQVLYFTCHRRELEAARAVAPQLNLVELA